MLAELYHFLIFASVVLVQCFLAHTVLLYYSILKYFATLNWVYFGFPVP